MRKKKEPTSQKPKVHKELEGFDIEINSFGEIKINYDLDKINDFLNRKVKDKKFKGVEGLDEMFEPEDNPRIPKKRKPRRKKDGLC